MNIRASITEAQHKLDEYIHIYQQFVDGFNCCEDVSDIYRQALLNNVERMKNMVFDSYKEALAIKASYDFELPPAQSLHKEESY